MGVNCILAELQTPIFCWLTYPRDWQ